MLQPLSLAPLVSSPSREQKFVSSRGEAVAIQIEVKPFNFNLDCFTSFAMTTKEIWIAKQPLCEDDSLSNQKKLPKRGVFYI